MPNNLKSIVAPPIIFDFEYQGKQKIQVKFNRMTLQHMAQLTSHYGEKVFNDVFINPTESIKNINLVCKMLTILINKEDQIKIKELPDEKIYFAEKDKEVVLASTVSEKLAVLFGPNIDSLYQLVEEVTRNLNENKKKQITQNT